MWQAAHPATADTRTSSITAGLFGLATHSRGAQTLTNVRGGDSQTRGRCDAGRIIAGCYRPAVDGARWLPTRHPPYLANVLSGPKTRRNSSSSLRDAVLAVPLIVAGGVGARVPRDGRSGRYALVGESSPRAALVGHRPLSPWSALARPIIRARMRSPSSRRRVVDYCDVRCPRTNGWPLVANRAPP